MAEPIAEQKDIIEEILRVSTLLCINIEILVN